MSGQREPHERFRPDGFDPRTFDVDVEDLGTGTPGRGDAQPPPSPGDTDPGYLTPPSPPKNE